MDERPEWVKPLVILLRLVLEQTNTGVDGKCRACGEDVVLGVRGEHGDGCRYVGARRWSEHLVDGDG